MESFLMGMSSRQLLLLSNGCWEHVTLLQVGTASSIAETTCIELDGLIGSTSTDCHDYRCFSGILTADFA